MVADIVNGITRVLGSASEGHDIYTKDVEQGIETPCFFVQLLKASKRPLIGKRHIRDYPFDIQYFPERDGDNEEMMDVGDALEEYLAYITLQNGNTVHGNDMSYEIVDGVLHFFVTCSVIMMEVKQEDSMDKYGLTVGVHDGKKH